MLKYQKLHGIGNIGFYFDFTQFLSLDWGFFSSQFRLYMNRSWFNYEIAFPIIAVRFFYFKFLAYDLSIYSSSYTCNTSTVFRRVYDLYAFTHKLTPIVLFYGILLIYQGVWVRM